ncbi:MAG: hypothetical protein ACLUGJ_19760 [Blautia wexlerae]
MENIIYMQAIIVSCTVDVGVVYSSEKDDNETKAGRKGKLIYIMTEKRLYIQSAFALLMKKKASTGKQAVFTDPIISKIIIVSDIF